MTAPAYANELEHHFYSLPSLIQSALHEPFTWMNDGLKQVSGNPQELAAAGEKYVALADEIRAIAAEQLTHRGKLQGEWTGIAYDGFSAKMAQLETELNGLADNAAKVKEILLHGADACVEGANLIVDIILTVLLAVLADFLVGMALSIISFGASVAAMVAKWIVEGLRAAAQVARTMEKVAAVLTKLVQLFEKLQRLFRGISKLFKEWKEILKMSKAEKKLATGLKEKAGETVRHATTRWIMNNAAGALTFGALKVAGSVGYAVASGKDIYYGHEDATQAQDAADGGP